MPYFEELGELEPGAESMKTVLGNFQLIKKIASGGMGDLYYGIQLSLRRPVAVKQLHPDLASDPKYIERFEREAVLLGAMSNENIVGVIEFGRESGFYYIVLEYVDGVSLAGLVKKVGPLPPNVALTIIEGAARGLAYAHKKGVVHRDINPANIMLSRDGIIKITDFGLAKPVGFSGDSGGLIVGTPGYMSPEQARGEEVDSRSDIFSLGLVFYELLAGKPAVEGTFPELFEKIKEPAEIPLDRLPPQTDRRLTEIIRKMIAKDKNARYQDISEALADIRRLRRDAPEFSSPAKLDEFLTEWEIVPPAPEKSDVVEKITHIETVTPESAGKVPETVAVAERKRYFRYRGYLEDLDPSHFVVRYSRYYIPFETFDEFVQMIEDGRNILVIGRPGGGKTRAVFEALERLKEDYPDWQVLIPRPEPIENPAELADISKGKHTIVVWDDIDQYVSIWEPNEIFAALREKAKDLVIIGTVRAGHEYKLVEMQKTDWLYLFDEQIKIPDLPDEKAVELAEKLGGKNTADFDGTPGSIVLDLRKVRARYNKLDNPHRGIMRAMKMLSLVEIWQPNRAIIQQVSNKFFNCNLDHSGVIDALHYLIENTFIKRDGETYKFYHNVYAHKVVTDYNEADLREDLDALTELLKDFGEPHYLVSLSRYFWLNYKYDRALELCNFVIESHPNFAEAYQSRGGVKVGIKDYPGAVEDYTKAIELNPRFAAAYNNRGVIRRRLGDIRGAIEDYNRSIELNPNFSLAYNNRGYAYFLLGDFTRAQQDFMAALRRKSAYDFLPHANLGILALYERRFSDAWREFEIAVSLHPRARKSLAQDPDILHWLENNPDDAPDVIEHLNRIFAPEKVKFDAEL